MAKNPIPSPPRGPVFRLLCTATVAALDSTAAGLAGQWKPLYRRLSELGGAPAGRVTAALEGWVMEGRKVSSSQIMKHVRELRKYRRYSHALEMMDWMETQHMELPFGCHAVRLDLISKVKGITSTEEYFSSLPEPARQKQTYGALLNCYCSGSMVDKAIALFEKMKELKLTSTTLVYNNLMSLYLKFGQLEKVPSLFQEMKASNVVPDNYTYRILMKSYALTNDIASVERSVQEMEGSQGASDWFTYCHLASIYKSAGLFKEAETALKKAELVMGSCDFSPFRFLISLYAGTGNREEVQRVWELLKARFGSPTNTNYLIMLQALKRLDDMDGLKQCFEEWESGCVNYDVRLVNVVIGAYLGKNMVKEAKSLQEKAAEKGAWSDLQTHGLFIDYYLQSREMELAQKHSKAATSVVKKGQLKDAETGGDDL